MLQVHKLVDRINNLFSEKENCHHAENWSLFAQFGVHAFQSYSVELKSYKTANLFASNVFGQKTQYQKRSLTDVCYNHYDFAK